MAHGNATGLSDLDSTTDRCFMPRNVFLQVVGNVNGHVSGCLVFVHLSYPDFPSSVRTRVVGFVLLDHALKVVLFSYLGAKTMQF